MYKIDVKPLSLNGAYRGRRFATPELREFKQGVWYLLPQIKVPKGKLKLKCIWGVSSKSSDCDNLTKTFLDVLAEKYSFNDKVVYKIDLEKRDVPKGSEYIEFKISAFK
jgi:Holliday junction resolvase RusA-like endonuclease